MKKNRTERNANLYRMPRTQGKLWFLTALCLTVLLSGLLLAGCSSNDQSPSDDIKEYSAKLWFVNQKYLESGDDSLPRYIIDERSVSVGAEDSPYQAVLTALVVTPEEDGAVTMIKDGEEIKSVALEEDGETAVVDLNSENLSGGGSDEELCLIEQIVWTLTESFDEIEKVQFTVDGSEQETLMGHMDISVPYGVISVDNGEGEGTDTVMPLYE